MTNIFCNDTYQISMLYAHWKNGREKTPASAEAFFRKLPGDLNFSDMQPVMAGAYRLNELLNSEVMTNPFTYEDMAFVQHGLLHLTNEQFEPFQEYLLEHFPKDLAALEVRYARDGELLYPNFPVVQVTGPIGALHMLETPILSFLNTSVRAATIARMLRSYVGHDKALLDFATRRQDDSAAVHVAVASVIGGFDGTSNMEAGRLYHVPAKGTMAHAYVLSYGMSGERQAFEDFIHTFPESHVLLVDTFDIQKGVANAIRASFETGIRLNAVRLDSGKWEDTLPATRQMLDVMGCTQTKIIVSGDFNESLITQLDACRQQHRSALSLIDGIGIGSRLGSPEFSMGFVYKLVEIQGQPVMKTAGGKSSLPGRKEWVRCFHEGHYHGNKLLPYVPNLTLVEDEEIVLREDTGPVPVGVEYIREARARTSRLLQTKGAFWDAQEVEELAYTLTQNV